SVSFFSTGIILGGQLTKIPQSQTYKAEPTQLTSNLTPDEQRLASKIDQLLQKSDYIGSIYVRKNNRVLLEKGYGYANLRVKESNSPSIYYQIGSIQKAMTALLILKQIQAGKLTFDTKLAEFYPQIPGSQQITIKNMLYMRSGLHRTA
ncbi:serine hydrolase domain-containing protein, partial [Enterococcus faecium]|uniref:serine hydrolase domain-containing protein n=1 Tax=Enterococcus faecium TaxID=1352 RepID=UPI003CF5A5E6